MSNRIKEIREDRGLSQTELAEQANTTQPQIARLEKSKRRLTEDWMKRLAKPLECHWTELVEEGNHIAEDEKAILGLYRGLSDQQKEHAHRLVATLQEPATDDNSDSNTNGKTTHKKTG